MSLNWLAALAIGLIATPAIAQVAKRGEEFQVNSFTPQSQLQPRVATFGKNKFVVVWYGANPSQVALPGTRARLFYRTGRPASDEFLVSTQAIQDERVEQTPDVAALSAGFVTAWQSFYESSDADIAAQRWDFSGQPVGSPIDPVANPGIESLPSVAGGARGRFAIAWTARTFADSTAYSVNLRAFRGSDTRSTQVILSDSPLPSRDVELVALQTSGYVAVWTQGDAADTNIVGQIVGNDGSLVGSNFLISDAATGVQEEPGVAALADGGFVVAWQSAIGDGAGYSVRKRMFGPDALARGPSVPVNTYDDGHQVTPSVSADAGGAHVVIWESFASLVSLEGGQDGSGSGVFGQHFDSEGERVGSEFQVNTYSSGHQGNLAFRESDVASWSDGGFVAVWASPDQDGDRSGIFAQLFDYDPTGARVCGDASDSDLVLSASDALQILAGAVGVAACDVCRCDVDGTDSVEATDALLVLRAALGLPVDLKCQQCT